MYFKTDHWFPQQGLYWFIASFAITLFVAQNLAYFKVGTDIGVKSSAMRENIEYPVLSAKYILKIGIMTKNYIINTYVNQYDVIHDA
jgi:hypothetical protein